MFIAPFGLVNNDSPIANAQFVGPYLRNLADKQSMSMSVYSEILMSEFNFNIECWILIGNVETLISYGYIECNNKMEVRLNPNIVSVGSQSQTQQEPVSNTRPTRMKRPDIDDQDDMSNKRHKSSFDA